MRLIKVGMGILNTHVGNVMHNVGKLVVIAKQMSDQGCTFGCFNEQTLCGYPCEDLVQRSSFIELQWETLIGFAKFTRDYPTIFMVGLVVAHNNHLYNAAAVVSGGRIWGIIPKQKLPTYNVFYEARNFTPGLPGQYELISGPEGVDIPFGNLVFETPFCKFGVEICEDIWSSQGPLESASYMGAEISFNLSSSPYRRGVVGTREEMISTRAADNQVTVVYVNQVGGQDALLFDGGAYVNQNGRMLYSAARWEEGLHTATVDLNVTASKRRSNTTWREDATRWQNTLDKPHLVKMDVDMALPTGEVTLTLPYQVSKAETPNPHDADMEDIFKGMTIGLRDYLAKNRGAFEGVVIAFSGGRDSFLTLLASHAWADTETSHLTGEEKLTEMRRLVRCYSMPSQFNSETTKNIARLACEELGVGFMEVPIQDAYERELEVETQLTGVSIDNLQPITKQNIQARIRGMRMWNLSNELRRLWLQTGNMTEKALGYTTVGGDMMGGFSLMGNLPKTVIIQLLEYLAQGRYQHLTSLQLLLTTESSAELADNQKDETDLMPFIIADTLLHLIAGEKISPKDAYLILCQQLGSTYNKSLLKDWTMRFVQLFNRSVFKWVLSPLCLHFGNLDLDREGALRLPVTNAFTDLEDLQKED